MPGMNMNGDSYFIKQWNNQALLGIIDGLGHGEEAAAASKIAKEYLEQNFEIDIEQLTFGLHKRLYNTRGAAGGLVRIDKTASRLGFCGIGNIEVRIIGDPPMHPICLDGIIGVNVKKVTKFEYQHNVLKAVVLHSDGISARFDLLDYPTVCQEPQKVAERILAEWGKEQDDATIIIAVEDDGASGENVREIEVLTDAHALLAASQAKELARKLGFSEVDQTKVAIVATELARNIVIHARGQGQMTVKSVKEPERVGIMLIAKDRGPGIADLEKAIRGQSGSGGGRRGGLGEGLAGAKRLMDNLKIETKVGQGTTIVAEKWKYTKY
jgi:anti-sigma regulatory factor (Ser/Thr protein kinase)